MRTYCNTEKLAMRNNFLLYPISRLSCRVFPDMTSRDQPPHREKGLRLRKRRKELQVSGVIGSVVELARMAGVTLSGYNQWERGETWPKGSHKAKLAGLMQWTEQELDYGPKSAGGQDVYPLSLRQATLLALFASLPGERQTEVLDSLRAEIATLNAIQGEVRGNVRPVPDEKVARHLPALTGNKKK